MDPAPIIQGASDSQTRVKSKHGPVIEEVCGSFLSAYAYVQNVKGYF